MMLCSVAACRRPCLGAIAFPLCSTCLTAWLVSPEYARTKDLERTENAAFKQWLLIFKPVREQIFPPPLFHGPVPSGMERTRLVSLVFRIPKVKLDAIAAMSRRTRIRQSEFLREAIADLLTKYELELDGGGE